VIVYFGSFFENYRSSTKIGHFFHCTSYVLIVTKHWLGYNIGDFVTDASGHPDPHHKKREKGDFE
jgi:hypothetical protein